MTRRKNNKEQSLEQTLWQAADKLRKNIDTAEYKHIVLGLIFLKYISDAFEEKREQLELELANPNSEWYMKESQERYEVMEDPDEYRAENVFFVPAKARWSYLQSVAKQPEIDALIVESGFAQAGPLLRLLGIDPQAIGFSEEAGFQNIEKIKAFDKPTLIIHAEYDHIIPYADGKSLFAACTSEDKTLLKIPDANHNDIFMRGLQEYLAAVKALVSKIGR